MTIENEHVERKLFYTKTFGTKVTRRKNDLLYICLLCLHGAAPILYVQAAILNLPYPYLKSTTTCG